MARSVCVIGAGASGLAAIKECVDAGLAPECLEMGEDIGGLWRFSPTEGHSSVARNTVINTSKEMMAFSDFPIPPEYPTFMHHTRIIEYFNLYAAHFQLRKYIQFHTRVTNVRPAQDYDETGRLDVTFTNTETKESATKTFDGVIICSGHHWNPSLAQFPGQEKFKGKILHSHSYKDWQGLEHINVVVVGIGNSGLDIAVELSRASKHVYLSTRSGAWIMGRFDPLLSMPSDFAANNRIFWNLPFSWQNYLGETFIRYQSGDMERLGIKPKYHILQAHPAINSELPGRIESGTLSVHPNVAEIKENSVVFEDGKEVPCDALILGTGYVIEFPFLDPSLHIVIENNRCPFYKFVFPPSQKHPTVAFAGLIQPLGAIMPISEMQCRWITQVFSRKLALPSEKAMLDDILFKESQISTRYHASKRHTIQVDYVLYMDELAKIIDVHPGFWRVWREKNLTLALRMVFMAVIPAQYRLLGKGAWDGAEQQCLRTAIYNIYPVNPKMAMKMIQTMDFPETAKKKGSGRSWLRTIVLLVALFYIVRRVRRSML